MRRRKRATLTTILTVVILVVQLVFVGATGIPAGPANADNSAQALPQPTTAPQPARDPKAPKQKITPAQRKAAADRAMAGGLVSPTLGTAQMATGTAPHYYGPFPNYANSPLRLPDAIIFIAGDGTGAEASSMVDSATGAITAITVTSGGTGYTAATVGITSVGGLGNGAAASATIDPLTGAVTGITVDSGGTGYVTPGIRKFVDTLPGLGAGGANNLGQYIPIAIPDTTTYPGSDYYEIGLVQYRERLHSDLPPTLLRGYVQLETAVNAGVSNHVALANANLDGSSTAVLLNAQPVLAVDSPHYLGPLISATKDRPVRILFRNLLPIGQGGNLFLPVDTTVMGAGMGPEMGGMEDPDPLNPMCADLPKPADCFTENRATLHLHGGLSAWISDGTPHQWITPVNETTPYPKGVSVRNVPDMPDPGDGAQTFLYSNQQSARLMFYHDHSWGITRLNVYAGEAAAYLISDPTEQSLVDQGLIPHDQIPLVIQDKTFVPSEMQLAMEDPTWNMDRWGGLGNLWVPHVYVPAQNPGDSSGVNAFGRWAYGPWFWPPTTNIKYGPVPNPYYNPDCNPTGAPDVWCEPELIPGTPYLSMGMEAFNDTPLVNGTAYPTLTVDPKSYRLRILNAANDRFWNLQFYRADGTGKDVTMVPAVKTAGYPELWPTDGREGGAPDPFSQGPNWIQFATEGGFLPAPVVVPNQPITWVTDPTVFNAGNVQDHSLLLGPAERADVVVDFSQFAGQTLILYNDAPAAFPALDPRYDYYSRNPDQTSTGGAPSTPAGYGPNTRTIMQIKVASSTPAAAFNMSALQQAFLATSLGGQGVFQTSQNPIIVGQAAYNSAYDKSFRAAAPRDGFARITDKNLSFDTLSGVSLTGFPMQPKAIQDEMGEAFDSLYGRMSGNLGLEAPGATAGAQNLILYPYVNPATEILDGMIAATPITTTTDGTQMWKFTHNGVDTHPIHFHLFDVQLVNRVGWDGIIRKPDANELGWKDTVRVSPLEDTIVAMRAIMPKHPFGVPDSIRPLNPAMPIGSTADFNNVDSNGNPSNPPITNQLTNFGWEYVLHCHILSHEEMDMMRPVVVNGPRSLGGGPVLTAIVASNGVDVNLNWSDPTPFDYATWTPTSTMGNPSNEIGFRIERASVDLDGIAGTYSTVGEALANVTSYVDSTGNPALNAYSYRVVAYNAAGDSPSDPIQVGLAVMPLPPTSLIATLQTGLRVSLSWTDNATTEDGFAVERAANGGSFVSIAMAAASPLTGTTTYTDTSAAAGNIYTYRVAAANSAGLSTYSNEASVSIPPAEPTSLWTAVLNGPQVGLSWTDNSTNETSFLLRRSANGSAFTQIATPAAHLGTGTTVYTDTSVIAGNSYQYQVAAANAAGTSSYALSSVVTMPAPPPAPSNLSIKAGRGSGTATATWKDNSTVETGFTIQQATNSTFTDNVTTVQLSANTTTTTFTGVTPGTYYYRVQAYNQSGNSGWSKVASIKLR